MDPQGRPLLNRHSNGILPMSTSCTNMLAPNASPCGNYTTLNLTIILADVGFSYVYHVNSVLYIYTI